MNAAPFSPFNTTVREFVRTAVDVPASSLAMEIPRLLAKVPDGVVYVVKDDSKRLVGLVTVCDLERLSTADAAAKAKDIATSKDIVAISPETTVADAIRIMAGENSIRKIFHVLPVVSDAYDLLGTVSRRELNGTISEQSQPVRRSMSY